MELSQKLFKLIKNKGITSYQVHADTGISQATLSQILNGKVKKVSLKTAKLLSDYFDVDRDYIMINDVEDVQQQVKYRDTSIDSLIENLQYTISLQKDLINRLQKENDELRYKLSESSKKVDTDARSASTSTNTERKRSAGL